MRLMRATRHALHQEMVAGSLSNACNAVDSGRRDKRFSGLHSAMKEPWSAARSPSENCAEPVVDVAEMVDSRRPTASIDPDDVETRKRALNYHSQMPDPAVSAWPEPMILQESRRGSVWEATEPSSVMSDGTLFVLP